MSLTSQLDLKDSPVKRFMRETFPKTRGPLAACRETLRLPLISPPYSKAYAQVGTAIDYRIRYHFSITPWHEFVAAHGAWIATLARSFGLTNACVAEFVAALKGAVDEIAPDRRLPTEAEERTLARYCLVLTALEAVFRAGPATPPPQYYSGTWPKSAADLVNLVPDDRVKDVAALGAAFAKQYRSWQAAGDSVLNPNFAGSQDIGGADADLIVDGCLWDIKTTKRQDAEGKWLYQLLGYTLLDYEDEYSIERVGLLFPRQNTKAEWPVDKLIAEMSGRDDLELAELRKKCRAVCESIEPGSNLDPAQADKLRAEYKAWIEWVEANGNLGPAESGKVHAAHTRTDRGTTQQRRSKCDGCGRRRVLNYWTNGSGIEVNLCRECLTAQRVNTTTEETVDCRCGTVIAALASHEAYCLDAIRHDWPRRSVASVAETRDWLRQQPELTAPSILFYMDAFERSDGRNFTREGDGWLCDACDGSVPDRFEQIDQFFVLLEAHRCEAFQ